MPITVGACRLRRVRLCLHPGLVSVLLDQRPSPLASHLQGETVRMGPIGRMTIKAPAWNRRLRQDGILVESTQAALINADVTTYLIARFDATIGQPPLIECIRTYYHLKILVLPPLPVFFLTHGKYQLTAFVLLGQCVPFIDIKISQSAIAVHLAPFTASDDDIHTVDGLVNHIKVQWRNIRRNGHPDIVRIYLWQLLHHRRMFRHRMARHQQEH